MLRRMDEEALALLERQDDEALLLLGAETHVPASHEGAAPARSDDDDSGDSDSGDGEDGARRAASSHR